ncbi:MAG TPA: cyclic nucleotide-binding domain-containing protein [Alphaproteobacteria bacterium]|nr:cyclic nucleotide-binding domain-containing protein [Alphaproteobacteria bacterium]
MAMTERHFAPGEIIYREGDKSDFAFFIKRGRVEILKNEAGGVRQVTVMGEGEIFGEMGVVLDQPRSVTARALDDVSVRAVSRSSFLQAVGQQPDMARSALRSLLARLHQDD